MTRTNTALIIVLLAGIALFAPVRAALDTPNATIDSAVLLLTEKLDGRKAELAANRQELYELIDEILLPRFDATFAAQVVLAKHWRSASKLQKERFIEAFYQAMLRKYADGVLEFDPKRVEVLPFRGDQSKPRAKVRTTVLLDDGSKTSVDYDVVKRDSGWLVFNVVIEGVSYVRNFRAELDAEIRNSSLDAVIARLEDEAGIAADE